MGGSSKPPATQTTTSEPPAYIAPYLKDAAGQAQQLYQSSSPSWFPGNTVAPMSDQTTQGLSQIQALAQKGGNLTPAANATLLKTIRGNNPVNPFLGQAVSAATAPIYDEFKHDTIPMLQSIFARSGGTGGSAEGFGADRAATALGRGLAEQAGTLAYNSAAQERQNQLNAVSLAPQMDAARYNDANALLGVGGAYDAQSQAQLQSQIDKYNYEQNLPALKLNQYIQQLQGGSQGGISTVTQANPQGSGALGILGGLATGASAGGAVGGPIGAAIGAGIGGWGSFGSQRGWF